MASITIPRNQIRTETPNPTTASVDLSPIARAAANAANTFNRIDEVNRARVLADAKTELDAGIADARNNAKENPDEFMSERFKVETDELRRSISEKYNLKGRVKNTFDLQAERDVSIHSFEVASQSRVADIQRSNASYITRTATRKTMIANSDDPLIIETAIQGQMSDIDERVSLFEMSEEQAAVERLKFENEVEYGSYVRQIASDPMGAMSALNTDTFMTLTDAQVSALKKAAAVEFNAEEASAHRRASLDMAREKAEREKSRDDALREIYMHTQNRDYISAGEVFSENLGILPPNLVNTIGNALKEPGGPEDTEDGMKRMTEAFGSPEYMGVLSDLLKEREITKETFFGQWNQEQSRKRSRSVSGPKEIADDFLTGMLGRNPITRQFTTFPSLGAAAQIRLDIWWAKQDASVRAGERPEVTWEEATKKAQSLYQDVMKLKFGDFKKLPAVTEYLDTVKFPKDSNGMFIGERLPSTNERDKFMTLTSEDFVGIASLYRQQVNAIPVGPERDIAEEQFLDLLVELEEYEQLITRFFKLEDIYESEGAR